METEAWKELDNAIFPSKENDGVEHVDLSYDEFFLLIKRIESEAYEEGNRHGQEVARSESHFD